MLYRTDGILYKQENQITYYKNYCGFIHIMLIVYTHTHLQDSLLCLTQIHTPTATITNTMRIVTRAMGSTIARTIKSFSTTVSLEELGSVSPPDGVDEGSTTAGDDDDGSTTAGDDDDGSRPSEGDCIVVVVGL